MDAASLSPWLFHAVGLAALVAFAAPRLTGLRLGAILACLLLVAALAAAQASLWMLLWPLAIAATNLAHLARNRLARSAALPPQERMLLRKALPSLSDSQLDRLIAAGARRDIAAGETLTQRGEVVARLYFLLSGAADVSIDGLDVARVAAGGFVGEMSFLTGRGASADVRAAFASSALVFDKTELDRLFERDADARSAFQMLIGADLADKVARGNVALRERMRSER